MSRRSEHSDRQFLAGNQGTPRDPRGVPLFLSWFGGGAPDRDAKKARTGSAVSAI